MNTFGRLFRVTTWGESHGPAVGAVVDGCPPGLDLCEEDIDRDLRRRRPGQSALTTARAEEDRVRILSGVFEGKTTGTPISLMLENRDVRSRDYDALANLFRPGHADFTYEKKYGIRDHRGSGRASGRETAGRVAGGAIARKLLAAAGIRIIGYTRRIGEIEIDDARIDLDAIERNPVRSPDPIAAEAMAKHIEEVRAAGDSAGGIAEILAEGVPPGLGDPVFGKLDADLAAAVVSVGAVKGVEFGDGFALARMRGSQSNDPFIADGTRDPFIPRTDWRIRTATNHAGGILGGISTGMPIVLRAVVKPTSSISIAQRTVRRDGTPTTVRVEGRHDPAIVIRVVPVLEAMTALVLADAWLAQRALRGRDPGA